MEQKTIVMQVLGCLMKNPLLLGDVNAYQLTPDDFSQTLDKRIFAAIYNLFSNGAEKISVVDIENYFQQHPAIYQDFINQNGIEYLQDAEDYSYEENFPYYYLTLKKHNAVKSLIKDGFDVNDFYPVNPLDNDAEEKLKKFEKMKLQDIFDLIRGKLSKLEGDYSAGGNTKVQLAVDGIKQLLSDLKKSPDVGVNLPGSYFNAIVRGARKGKFYLQSAATNVGKTRRMVGSACLIAYPVRYDWDKRKWDNIGSCKKVMYVGTEQEIKEIQTLILAYLSGINEEKLLSNSCNQEEQKILGQAIQVMEMYSDNFTIAQLPDPTIQLVKSTIRKECLLNNVEYVFYDYIFSSPGLLGEFRDLKIREDVVLNMLSTALKDLAVELDIYLQSATQVNGDTRDFKGLRDQRCIRGAKAIADKIDVGIVTEVVSAQELNTLSKLIERNNFNLNQVSDVYKVRSGRFNHLRIWTEADLGTCRFKDLFATDENFQPIKGLVPVDFDFQDGDSVSEVLKLLNGDMSKEEVETIVEQAASALKVLDQTDPENWKL